MTERWHWREDPKTRTVILVYVRGRTSHTRDVVLRDLDNGRVKGVASRIRSGTPKEYSTPHAAKRAQIRSGGSLFTVIA